LLATAVLLVWLPAWMVSIRRRPSERSRAIIVGDDPVAMEAILDATDLPVIGYVSPPSSYEAGKTIAAGSPELPDGGAVTSRLDELSNLGGLSRFDEVLVRHEGDTALLAFTDTDRAEFFGTLDTCYDHGVTAMVHRDHADDVLTAGVAGGDLVKVDLDPWDWQDYVAKRLFDVAFAGVGLLVLLPVMIPVAVAIKLDSPGPVLYSQERTAEFGQTFTVYKFRTMTVGGERAEPGQDEGKTRVTRVGHFLRQTHLDEIPQLLAILFGRMSVVGPRAVWTDEEVHLERTAESWRKRWFVKPGLTGLAQINGVTSTEPDKKLRYDIEYIRKQSFWFDLRIVVRQIWLVVADVVGLNEEGT